MPTRWEGLNPPYSTIVADPPWTYEKFPPSHTAGSGFWRIPLPYSMMSVEEIGALPVSDLGAADAHLYLWTTNRYLRESYEVAEAWGFTPAKPLVWCKAPKAPFYGGAFGGSSVEFCLFARRGSLATVGTAGRQWWDWPRGGMPSAKPAAFLDVVERVSPGPYVELFARQPRLGWDSWGWGYEESKSVGRGA